MGARPPGDALGSGRRVAVRGPRVRNDTLGLLLCPALGQDGRELRQPLARLRWPPPLRLAWPGSRGLPARLPLHPGRAALENGPRLRSRHLRVVSGSRRDSARRVAEPRAAGCPARVSLRESRPAASRARSLFDFASRPAAAPTCSPLFLSRKRWRVRGLFRRLLPTVSGFRSSETVRRLLCDRYLFACPARRLARKPARRAFFPRLPPSHRHPSHPLKYLQRVAGSH